MWYYKSTVTFTIVMKNLSSNTQFSNHLSSFSSSSHIGFSFLLFCAFQPPLNLSYIDIVRRDILFPSLSFISFCPYISWSLVQSQLVSVEIFIDIKSFRSHYGPGIDSASNRNEYQEHFLGVRAAGV